MKLSDLHFRGWDANENTVGQYSKVFSSLYIVRRLLCKSEEVVLFCFYDSLSSWLCISPWIKNCVCYFSFPLTVWLVRLVRKPVAYYLVSSQELLQRVHVAQCRIFHLSYYPATQWTLFEEEQMLSSKGPLCAKDTPHIPPPSYSF